MLIPYKNVYMEKRAGIFYFETEPELLPDPELEPELDEEDEDDEGDLLRRELLACRFFGGDEDGERFLLLLWLDPPEDWRLGDRDLLLVDGERS